MTLDQCWALSADWYGGRLEPDYQPPSGEQRQAQLARVGLTDDPWSLR